MQRDEQILSLRMDSDGIVVVLVFIWSKVYCYFLGHSRGQKATL
jgi:hypothetical protein